MFTNILVAEDSDGFNLAIKEAFKELSISGTHARYCDDALLKQKKALSDGAPFDLLISDLSFRADHRTVNLRSGEELIAAVKQIQADIPVIVFSIEDSAIQIQSLFERHAISGYVFKGRKSIPQLVEAISAVYNGIQYISPEISHKLHDKSLGEIDDYDVLLLEKLSTGLKTEDIAAHFKNINLSPFSTSAIEKRINKLKVYFGANNGIHLISLAKDLRVIK